jgi:dihydrofolate reductase
VSVRKVIVYIATSADGFIARPDGSVDWLDRPESAGDYGMGAFRRSIDSIVLGRKTYEFGLEHGARFAKSPRHYVFSRNPRAVVAAPNVELVTEGPAPFVRRLKARKTAKNIWMMGGAELIGAFVDEGLIDEFIIHVMPTIGEGIPLMPPRHRNIELELRSCERFADGVVRLHYRVA